MQYSDVLLLSKDNLLRNTLQARISNLFLSNILEGAKVYISYFLLSFEEGYIFLCGACPTNSPNRWTKQILHPSG